MGLDGQSFGFQQSHLQEMKKRCIAYSLALRQGHLRRDDAAMRMGHAVERRLERGRTDLQRLQVQLNALNPRAVLSRGFTLSLVFFIIAGFSRSIFDAIISLR